MIRIDANVCNACGLCGKICPRYITETIGENGEKRTVLVEERTGLCLNCGQCAAICSTGAIAVDGPTSTPSCPWKHWNSSRSAC